MSPLPRVVGITTQWDTNSVRAKKPEAMSEIHRKNILIFELDHDTSELFARALESKRSCKCYLAYSAGEALDLLRDIPFALMILDLKSAMADDFKLLKQVLRTSPETGVIVDGYLHQKEHIHKALSLGAKGHIIKPVKLEVLRKKIEEFTLESASSIV